MPGIYMVYTRHILKIRVPDERGRRNLLPLLLEMLLPLLLLPLPQLPRAAAMARDLLLLVGQSMPE